MMNYNLNYIKYYYWITSLISFLIIYYNLSDKFVKIYLIILIVISYSII